MPEERAARPHNLASMVEHPDKGFKVLAGAHFAVPPLAQKSLESLQLLAWETELPCDSVNLDAQEHQARRGTIRLMFGNCNP